MLILVWFVVCIIFYFVQLILGDSGHSLELFAVLTAVALFLICLIFVIYYLFRPTSKKEKDQFNDKNNWRGGF